MVQRKYPTLAALIPSAVGVDMSFLSTVTGVALSIEDADDSSDDDAESTSTNEKDSDVSSDADSTCDEQEQAQQLPNMIPIVPVPVRHRRRTFAQKPMNQSTFWTSHSRPHLLRTGDQHYCHRPLSKILAGAPATRRRWLRKVKQSTAELTKDGTRQTLLTNFFRIN
jgi:hypothetical protein